MITRIRSFLLWSKIFKLYQAEKYKAASEAADIFRIRYRNHAIFRALDATLDILNHKSPIAQEKFNKLSEYLSGRPERDAKYIKIYCDYYLCLISKSPNCEDLRKKGLNTSVSSSVRRWLPLPHEPVE